MSGKARAGSGAPGTAGVLDRPRAAADPDGRGPGPTPGRTSVGRGRRGREALLLVALVLLALAARLPYHQEIPVFTDEAEDIYRGYLITQGKLFPLVDAVSSYDGSLWDWLLAGSLRVSGESIYAARALILVFGALTVVPTYLLGRAWGGRAGGLLAAALLITATSHILINSHLAWSNSMTPFFVAFATWFLYRAVRRGRRDGETERRRDRETRPALPRSISPSLYLPAAGLFWGLAFQTHPTVIGLLPAAAVFLLWRGRPLVRTRWAGLAVGLFILVNLNVLIYNLTSGFDSVADGLSNSAKITGNAGMFSLDYFTRVARLGLGLYTILSGAGIVQQDDVPFLGDPGRWPIAALAAVAVLRQWRRGNPLPGLLLLSMALVVPLFIGRFNNLFGRYLTSLLPILFAAVGALMVEVGRLRPTGWRRPGEPSAQAAARVAAVGLLAAFLVLHPLLYLRTYYAGEVRLGRTNATFFRAVEQIKANRRADQVVLVDRPPDERSIGLGGGWVSSIFQALLSLERIPYRLVDLNSPEWLDPAHRCHEDLAIVSWRNLTQVNQDLVDRLDLRGLDGRPAAPPRRANDYPIYRMGPFSHLPASC